MQAVRSKVAWPALGGRRCNRLGYLAAMRERQPGGQLAGRLLRGLAVEGHHRRRHTRFSRQLGTPPVADGRNVDFVRTPTYRFFEVVDHLSGGPTDFSGLPGWDQTLTNQSGAPVILRGRHGRSSEGKREGAVHSAGCGDRRAIPSKKNLRAQLAHKIFTGHPQVFHSWARCG